MLRRYSDSVTHRQLSQLGHLGQFGSTSPKRKSLDILDSKRPGLGLHSKHHVGNRPVVEPLQFTQTIRHVSTPRSSLDVLRKEAEVLPQSPKCARAYESRKYSPFSRYVLSTRTLEHSNSFGDTLARRQSTNRFADMLEIE